MASSASSPARKKQKQHQEEAEGPAQRVDEERQPAVDGCKDEAAAARESQNLAATKAEEEEASDGSDDEAPAQLLLGCTAPQADVPLAVAVSMDAETYQEMYLQSRFCSLQLRVASASAEELENFPARLPAADAAMLSAVLKTRLRSWEAVAAADGVTVLELQIDVQQQLLDAVVRGVYARKLSVEPSNAQSLLLLADYLQLGWLTQAVARYLREHVLSERPLVLCKLSNRFPGLDLYKAVADFLVGQEPPQPQQLVALVQLTPEPQRHATVAAIVQRLTPPECYELYMCLDFSPERDFLLNSRELALVLAAFPELAMSEEPSEARPLSYRAGWGRLYALLREANQLLGRAVEAPPAKQRPAARFLVWDLPLRALHSSGSCNSPSLVLAGNRSFQLMAQRWRKDTGSPWQTLLRIKPGYDVVWTRTDAFRVGPVLLGDKQDICRKLRASSKYHNTREPLGWKDVLGIWSSDDHTICGGDFLPLAFEAIVPPPMPPPAAKPSAPAPSAQPAPPPLPAP